MGVFYQPLAVAAAETGPYEEFRGLVDTGSLFTWVPGSALRRIGLQPTGKRQFYTADSRVIERDVCRAWVRIEGREDLTLVVFGGDTDHVLLGAYTLEGLGLAADPVNRRLIPMPAIPAATPIEPSP
jgi:clan AA aspartic protease